MHRVSVFLILGSDKYHAWVNAEFLLEKCVVGTLDESQEPSDPTPTSQLACIVPVALELRPPLTTNGQRGATKFAVYLRGVLGLLIKRKKYLEGYDGVFEPGILGQTGHVELVDVKPGPVGPETEPEDEGDEAQNEKEAQECGTYDFGERETDVDGYRHLFQCMDIFFINTEHTNDRTQQQTTETSTNIPTRYQQ
ncbi:hypothetical protein V8G54_013216 [Vigna mungo]|uniref:Uncharacterized protein n=1 Tax=Vigna mungo TaxID=3915 RepID=A0AAQ3NTP3_VIGMU